jgi:hypothetical protein
MRKLKQFEEAWNRMWEDLSQPKKFTLFGLSTC